MKEEKKKREEKDRGEEDRGGEEEEDKPLKGALSRESRFIGQ